MRSWPEEVRYRRLTMLRKRRWHLPNRCRSRQLLGRLGRRCSGVHPTEELSDQRRCPRSSVLGLGSTRRRKGFLMSAPTGEGCPNMTLPVQTENCQGRMLFLDLDSGPSGGCPWPCRHQVVPDVLGRARRLLCSLALARQCGHDVAKRDKEHRSVPAF